MIDPLLLVSIFLTGLGVGILATTLAVWPLLKDQSK